ncbi:MAG: hypothetical protein JST86_12965 [Bacteroidetes bacterium]|nr:hypothetical protein [Bacteroidota bacterium]
MKKMVLLAIVSCFTTMLFAQQVKDRMALHRPYVSFNPLGLIEPYAAIGLGLGNHLSNRSGYFTELSFVCNNYIYPKKADHLQGFKYLAQYRYYLMQSDHESLGPVKMHHKKYYPYHLFFGAEFRYKHYYFSDHTNFINAITKDTLSNFMYNAKADIWGGAIIFGGAFPLGKSNHWQLECTLGIGAKQKWVAIKNNPSGYEPETIKRIDVGTPAIWESVASPYLPWTIRLQYKLK